MATAAAPAASSPSSLTGTGNQAYTKARVEYLASYLQTLVPGLSHQLAVEWINAEKGANGNVLGVTYRENGKQHLYTYSSQEAGLRAAVGLLHRSSHYHPFLTTVKAYPGNYKAQVKALVATPWNHNYYSRVWMKVVGNTVGQLKAGGSSGTVSGGTQATLASETMNQATHDILVKLGISTDPAHVITDAEAWAIAIEGYGLSSDHANAITQETHDRLVGRTIGDWVGGLTNPTDPLTTIAQTFTGIGNVVSGVTHNLPEILALVVGIPLSLLGFYLLAGVPTGSEA